MNDDFGLDELNEGVDLREKFQPISYENEMKKRAQVAPAGCGGEGKPRCLQSTLRLLEPKWHRRQLERHP